MAHLCLTYHGGKAALPVEPDVDVSPRRVGNYLGAYDRSAQLGGRTFSITNLRVVKLLPRATFSEAPGTLTTKDSLQGEGLPCLKPTAESGRSMVDAWRRDPPSGKMVRWGGIWLNQPGYLSGHEKFAKGGDLNPSGRGQGLGDMWWPRRKQTQGERSWDWVLGGQFANQLPARSEGLTDWGTLPQGIRRPDARGGSELLGIANVHWRQLDNSEAGKACPAREIAAG
ncbi:hypothetical protein R1flu_027256 [Riccia fluitans]|uniref:Uncharacterized protein n=1 Tax=Riccia fluitans TaxID=41844 RepID=A0ABD1XMC4_9MARC